MIARENNDQPQDYGPTIITAHDIKGRTLYVLHGHLSRSSLSDKSVGQAFTKGSRIGWVGDRSGKWGWNPRFTHFQLNWLKPYADLQGVVSPTGEIGLARTFPRSPATSLVHFIQMRFNHDCLS